MKAFEASVTIHAPAEAVWAILTDAAAFPDWEPNVTHVEGNIAPGKKITVHSKLSDRVFPVTVSEFVPNKRMVWSSGMPLGLFKGARTFTLSSVSTGVRFTTREEFSGLLLPLFSGQIGDLQPSFDAFVAALKAKVESM